LKIKDRLPAIDELLIILEKVLKRLKAASRDCIPKDMIKQNNLMLLDVALRKKAKKVEF
jgi:hypothetical protein